MPCIMQVAWRQAEAVLPLLARLRQEMCFERNIFCTSSSTKGMQLAEVYKECAQQHACAAVQGGGGTGQGATGCPGGQTLNSCSIFCKKYWCRRRCKTALHL